MPDARLAGGPLLVEEEQGKGRGLVVGVEAEVLEHEVAELGVLWEKVWVLGVEV